MPTSPDNSLTPQPGAKILVVDDEPFVRDLVARWLADESYACAQAGSAQAAWDHLQTCEADLVTLDITMPGANGIDLLHRIAQAWPDTAVIMMTAVGETQTAIEALTHGASAYLIKPVSREELGFQVRRALERRQLLLEKRQYAEQLERKVLEQTAALRSAQEEVIHRLVSASLFRDVETGTHIRRTGLLSELLARGAGWSAAEAKVIRLAAPMHDVGKIGIPDAILRKPGKLTPDEFEIMKTHSVLGAAMLADSAAPMLRMAQEIALGHHEHWDGNGYPAGLSGHAIPESARIVAIVDVYDALTHGRVYRPALPEEEALSILRKGAGSQFDPLLLATFFSCLEDVSRILRENPDGAAEGESPGLSGWAATSWAFPGRKPGSRNPECERDSHSKSPKTPSPAACH